MNHITTYHDSTTAWLSSDGMLSWVTSTMYERFSGGGYMSGVKLVRGYTESKKPEKPPATPTGTRLSNEPGEKEIKALKRRSAPPSMKSETRDEAVPRIDGPPEAESRGSRLQRQLSSLMESAENRDSEGEEEQIRKREEQEIQDDYNPGVGETQGREIEHLVLVTHGIGQLLGLRCVILATASRRKPTTDDATGWESINFVHDVNILRKTLKSVYAASADLRALKLRARGGSRKLPGPGLTCVLAPSARLSAPEGGEERRARPGRDGGGGVRV